MTTPGSGEFENSFAAKKLLRWIGAGAILFYLITLARWITPDSLETISRVAGWNPLPAPARPLAWTVFATFGFLPDTWVPLAANLFTAIVATLVLAILARCVALLRYDVLPEGDVRKGSQVGLLTIKSAWMPPVLAVLICGLQLGFWEHATAATGEMPALLLFALALRCLLEFRITKNESWLACCAMCFGAGMADNWVMLGYFPVLLAALIGLKGFSPCLKPRFLLRMTSCGLAGMALCLVIPLLAKLISSDSSEMWAMLLEHLKTQKRMLWLLKLAPFRLLALTGLIPLLILSVRWKSHTIQLGDDTPQGVFLTKATGHFIHAFFIAIALWFAFEPKIVPKDFESAPIQLIQSFLWALVGGYCAGYVLLFKQNATQLRPSKLAANAVQLVMLAMTGLLLWKNHGSLRLTNSAAMREFAKTLADDLPEGKSVVLSEERQTLLLLRGELGACGRARDVMLVDTPQLISPRYHALMAANHGARWPTTLGTNTSARITPNVLLETVVSLAEKEAVLYAHPSSGLFFEKFEGTPKGSVQRLTLRTSGGDSVKPNAEQLSGNERLWQARWSSHLERLTTQILAQQASAARWKNPSLKWLLVTERKNKTATFLSGAVSKAMNHWGVQLQRPGRSAEAMEWFRRAIKLNPSNLAALINLGYAERRSRGENAPLAMSWAREQFAAAFEHYASWYEVISRNGPVDEPTYLLQTGRLLQATGNPRQAVAAFTRCGELCPNWPMPKLFEAQSYNQAGAFERALELTTRLENQSELFQGAGLARLLQFRVTALRGLNRTNEAWEAIEHYVSKHEKHGEVISTAAGLCSTGGKIERELELLVELTARVKTDTELMTRRGLAEFRLGRNKQAVETLTRALELAPDDVQSRLLRAMARLGDRQLDAARADYEVLLKNPGSGQPALLGLGNMAWSAQDTNAAIRYYEQFISNNAALTPQAGVVSERLKQMKDD